MEKQNTLTRILTGLEKRIRSLEQQQHLARTIRFDFLDAEDVFKMLKISKRSLTRYRENGTLRYTRLNGKIFSRLSELEKILDSHMTCKTSRP